MFSVNMLNIEILVAMTSQVQMIVLVFNQFIRSN